MVVYFNIVMQKGLENSVKKKPKPPKEKVQINKKEHKVKVQVEQTKADSNKKP